jgi:hypothetical protein
MAFRRIFHKELEIYIYIHTYIYIYIYIHIYILYIYIHTYMYTFNSYRPLMCLVAQFRKLFFLPSGLVAKTFICVRGKNIESHIFVLFKLYLFSDASLIRSVEKYKDV